MKILTKLSAAADEATWTEPRGVLQVLHNEPVSGFFRQVTLGAGGVIVSRGPVAVGIPLGELLRLAEEHEPRLAPPAELPAKGSLGVSAGNTLNTQPAT